LGRLVGADYSSRVYFEYTYDSVGNRLSQTIEIDLGLPPVTTGYAYDIANRMTVAGGVTYTWDDNGNLLEDGKYTYTYDYANRLVAVSDPQSAVSYLYNGLGEGESAVWDPENNDWTCTDKYITGSCNSVFDSCYFVTTAIQSSRITKEERGW